MRKYIIALVMAVMWCSCAYPANTKPPAVVIEYAYQEARDFHEGLAAVKQNDRWGYIDYLGRIAIPFIFRGPDAGDFSDGFAFVEDHYIDTNGNPAFVHIDEDTDERIERFFNNGLPFSNGLAAVKYINKCIQSLLQQDYPGGDMEWIFVDGGSTDNTVDSIRKYAADYPNLIKILDNPHKIVPYAMNMGIMQSKGKYIIRPAYYEAGNFSDGLAPVRSRTNYRGWGYIRPNGKFAIPRRYNIAGDFGDGLAPAAADARWGYVNVRGEWDIPAQFDDARPFSEGLAAVKREKKWGYIRP